MLAMQRGACSLIGMLWVLGGCDSDDESGRHRGNPDLGLGIVDMSLGGEVGVVQDEGLRADVSQLGDAAVDRGPDIGPAPCIEDAVEECGDCDGAVWICRGGTWSDCMNPTERCNRRDDDCDGRTDEGFAELDQDCMSGEGACARPGRWTCAANGMQVQCSGVPGMAEAESCNRVDDDCDGRVDDEVVLPCYPGPEATRSVGLCTDGGAICEVGAPADCQGAVLPDREICNTFDDDCDGFTDEEAVENPCYSGPLATRNVGLCGTGIRFCVAGVAGPCSDEVLPAREICDGRDNNCDGVVDEDMDCACEGEVERPCYSGPEESEGVGACQAGLQRCIEGRWGACDGEQVPEAEVCDGRDGDCNGRVDDGVVGVGLACFLGRGLCRADGILGCDSNLGALICDARPGEPMAERCNQEDDDCDGLEDEGLGLGDPCTAGVGVCQAAGRGICDASEEVRCDAPVGRPNPELCNFADDDCDGLTDEDFALDSECRVGRGACLREGVRVCEEGVGVCSARAGDPVPEFCDGIDQDCDGQIDNGNPGGGQDCNTGLRGVCAAGVRTCRGGVFECLPQTAAADEICDGLDNDCDGGTDEARAGGALVEPCYDGPPETANAGLCRAGLRACVDGAFGGCAGQVLPGQEICNLDDDDCDGTVDEGLDQICVCRPMEAIDCYSGPAETLGVGACRAGQQVCLDGAAFGPCEGQLLPEIEVCDAIDNDCNGLTDDLPGIGAPCQVGIGGCSGAGVRICNPATGRLQCSAEPGAPQEERCNGVDDDCNGLIDDAAGLGEVCEVGRGACNRRGNRVCEPGGGLPACNAMPGDPAPEVCDGDDDDCDGVSDEDVPGAGDRCTVGLGQCRRAGENICEGATGRIICGATPGVAGLESCNGLDDDCDGRTDENAQDVGGPCEVGVGSCASQGTRRCVGGMPVCDARPGAPGLEVCNEYDDDCDGRPDEGLECRAFRSCQDALDQGFDRSGVYRLDPDGDGRNAFDVWCDQVIDGGGWTLVASSRNAPPNDLRSDWYADLSTLAPAAAHAGVWGGMRDRFGASADVRFACRDAVRLAGAPFSVDLSFYAVPWYREVTTGVDVDSCFSEGGSPDLPPARRNNLSGEIRGPGQGWHAQQGIGRALKGEDSCVDAGDFTVDFEDQGMDSNPEDGTDWGEDDGTFKCGESGLVSGQWFLYAREQRDAPLARVAVIGAVNLEEPLRTAGFQVTTWAFAALPARLDLRPFDAVFLGRYGNDWRQVTPDLVAALEAYSLAGGHLITEWDGAALFSSRYQPDFRFLAGNRAPLGWFPFAFGAGIVRGLDTPVAPVPAHVRDPILRSLPDPIRGAGGTEQFFTVSPLDQGIPIELVPIARFPGQAGSPSFPAATYPALLRGARCGGHVLIAPFDYQDRPISASIRQLIINLAASTSTPPEPTTPDLCP